MASKTLEFTPGEAAFLANVCLVTEIVDNSLDAKIDIANFAKNEADFVDVIARLPAKPVKESTVNKALEEEIIHIVTKVRPRTNKSFRRVSDAAVFYLTALRLLEPTISKKKKNEFYSWFVAIRKHVSETGDPIDYKFPLGRHLMFDLSESFSNWASTIDSYSEARDEYIHIDSEVMGGTPVIRGTRITVYSVLGRLEGGDTIEDILQDYPDIPELAFETAVVYARTHPRQGRPAKFR